MPQRPGTLLSLRLQNFGPHTDVTFSFPSALNIIVAPNGSGKSTIVNGISLVFGGAPRSLNRGQTVDQFIKDNTDTAHITVEIVDLNGAPMKLRRTMTRQSGGGTGASQTQGRKRAANAVANEEERHSAQSKYFINDRLVNKTDITSLVERLRIQVENLCQFLPQDRVDDFTKMTPADLLDCTQLAVGGSELVQLHKELKNRAGSLASNHNDVETKAQELDKLKDQNKPLEAQITADEHRRELESELTNMRDVQLVQTFQVKKRLAVDAKKVAEDATAALVAVDNELKPLEQRLEHQSRLLSRLSEEEFVRLKKTVQDRLLFDTNASRQLQDSFGAASKARQHVRDRIDDLRRTRGQIPELKADLENKQQRLSERRPVAQAEEELRKVKTENQSAEELKFNSERAARTHHGEVQQLEQTAATLRNRLGQLQSIQQRRLDSMRNSDPHTYNAAMWIRDNTASFESEVFGPIQTMINPSSKLAARILESVIPGRDMRAFVAQTPGDQRTLASLSRPPNNWKINVNYAGSIANTITPLNIEPLRAFGIDAVLSDLFDCSPVLKRYLCQQYHLHMIPVATKHGVRVDGQSIFDSNRNIRMICTDEFVFSVANMRYSQGCRIFSDSGLPEHVRVLGESVDPRLVDECQAEIDRVAKQLEAARANLQEASVKVDVEAQRVVKIRERGTALVTEIKETLRMQKDVEAVKNSLSRLRQTGLDFERLAADAQRELDVATAAQMKLVEEKDKAIRAANDAIRRGCELAVEIRLLERQVEQAAVQVGEMRTVRNQRLAEKRAADNEAQLTHATAMELKTRALEAVTRLQAVGIDIKNHTDAEAVIRRISELTNQIDALQAPMDHRQRQLYEERCARIAKLEDDVKNGKLHADTYRNKLEKDGTAWRKRISDTVEGLSEHFSNSMLSFGTGCSGAVVFTQPEDLSNYNNYGLELRVAFRSNMPLRAVSPAYQSGGERAVTALNYILALHHFTQSPFVVVDELNQGMDPMNERRSYQFLARTCLTTGSQSSQFIWITPKATSQNADVFATPGIAMLSIGKRIGNIQISTGNTQEQERVKEQQGRRAIKPEVDGENAY